jgi:hypothetical protein
MFRNFYRRHLSNFTNDRALVWLAFFSGVITMLMYRPFVQFESGDQSIWDYIAQAILRGQIPYRDVIEIKTPLSAYLSAFMMALLRPLSVPDVLAIRLLYVLLVGALAATTFYVAKIYMNSRMIGIIAVLTLLMSDHFISWMFSGTEPKLLMLLFGLFTLLFLAKDRPFLAGVCSMLSFLSWQPGLLFTGTAMLVFSNYLTRWRDGKGVKVLAGAALPLVITLLYFSAQGALDDLWKWTITYNYKIYAPMAHKTDSALHVAAIFYRVFRYEIILPILSLFGLIIFIKDCLKARFKNQPPTSEQNFFSDGLWIPSLVYLLFCLINLQAGPDLTPLFPFIGLFSGFALLRFSGWLNEKFAMPQHMPASWLPKLAAILMLAVALWNAQAFWRQKGSPLREQIQSLESIKEALNEHDTIYAHGATEILVLLNRPNANPYLFLDFGKDEFIASQLPEGVSSFIAELETQKPRVVILARMRKVEHKEELRNWAESHYNKFAVVGYDEAYIRKPNQ